MADFPSKVATETGAPSSHNSQQGGNSLGGMAGNVAIGIDMSFIRSIPGILMMVEIVLGLLHWALVASVPYVVMLVPSYGWVLFVAITLWILTIILFFLILFGAQRHLAFVPWPLTVMVYHGAAAVLYLTAFATNAAYVHPFSFFSYDGQLGAGAFFAAVVMLAYAASTFFSYLDWRGDGGNTATNTVPT